MATNRRKIMRNRRQSDLPEALKLYFLTGEQVQGLDGDRDLKWLIVADTGKFAALWEIHREVLLAEWIESSPCARPWAWWKYDAPKELVPGCDGSEYFAYQAHRQRIGGTGTPAYEALAVVPHFSFGLPDSWLDDWTADPGRGDAVDLTDPPVYESQAAYLLRHGLLTAEEKRHLKKNPDLLEPEVVVFEDEGEGDDPADCTSP